jgi:sporulation protein YlmC with PRC-barrel domain
VSDELSLRFDFLDKQIVDCDGYPFGRVEDVELECDDGEVRVVALRTGSEALGLRLHDLVGRWLAAASARLRPPGSPTGPTVLPAALVADAGAKVELSVSFEELEEVAALERWLARHVVGRIPGAGDAGE